jgi:flagellar capping protein FliD
MLLLKHIFFNERFAQTQKKQLQSELGIVTKQRNEAIEKSRSLEGAVLKKEREVTDLLNKVNDTIRDYEGRLEKKEEQMWAITEKMSEGNVHIERQFHYK